MPPRAATWNSPNPQLDGSRAKSLLHLLDRTVTPQGGRRLRRWLEQPLLALDKIKARHDGVADFVGRLHPARRRPATPLRGIADLERLTARACAGMANARATSSASATLWKTSSNLPFL